MDFKKLLETCTGFDWDEGNSDKNWIKHRVSKEEAEQIFFNIPLVLSLDEKHPQTERRFFALGNSNSGRTLTIIFTVREKNLIRVISVREMSKKEKGEYEKTNKKNT